MRCILRSSYVLQSDEEHLIQQSELNDLVHNSNPSTQQAKLLGSSLLQWNFLAKETRISLLRKRHEYISGYYRMQESL
jgi:hypothetical protein